MFNSINMEKPFDKIKYSLMLKNTHIQQTETRRECPQINEGHLLKIHC